MTNRTPERVAAALPRFTLEVMRRAVIIRATALGVSGLVVLLGVFLAVLAHTARVIVRPVTRLTRAAREVHGGALETRVPERSAAELGELEETFNAMAQALGSRTRELERFGARRAAMLDAVFARAADHAERWH